MGTRTGKAELGQAEEKLKTEVRSQHFASGYHVVCVVMNLCVIVHFCFLPAPGPARPVQKLLSEQSRLVVLRDAAEQRPAGTSLSPPGDIITDLNLTYKGVAAVNIMLDESASINFIACTLCSKHLHKKTQLCTVSVICSSNCALLCFF